MRKTALPLGGRNFPDGQRVDRGPWDLLVTDNMLCVGGYFDLVGGVSKFFLARFTNV